MVKLGKDFVYDGLIITSIDYKIISEVNVKPIRVEFAENTPGNEEKRLSGDALRTHNKDLKDTATFLENVKFINHKDDVDGKRRFEADLLTITEAKAKFDAKYNKKYEKEIKEGAEVVPFFSIHGFNNEAGYVMDICKIAQGEFDKQYEKGVAMNVIIPVIWPSEGSTEKYDTDRNDNATEAGKELQDMVKKTLATSNVFKKKNLLCHSMGNRILCLTANENAADENVKFDNIFLAAADIRHNIFNKEYIDPTPEGEETHTCQGINIFGMLTKNSNGKPKGKIYCLYNGSDYALGASSLSKWVNRLGQVGIGSYANRWKPWADWEFDEKRLLHPDIFGYTENFNVYPELPSYRKAAHGYQWDPFSVKYYREKINKTV